MPQTNAQTQARVDSRSQPGGIVAPASLLLRFRRPLILFTHLAAFSASLMLSFLVVHNMQIEREWFVRQYPALLLFFFIVKLPTFGLFKQYRGWWRYVGISDLLGIVRASMISTMIIMVLWFVLGYIYSIHPYLPAGLEEPAEGVCIADMFATVLILSGLRMVIRLYHESIRPVEAGRLRRFLIVGAGNAGEALLREMRRMQYEVVGFIDDDPAKQGTQIHGIPVLGTVAQLPEICRGRNIEEIAVAMPSATARQLRRVIQACEGTKIRFRTVPSITDIASGKLRVSQIRDVDINDLLGKVGREAVQLDLDSIEAFAKDKTILITGAGGSIGSEMCRQLCGFRPRGLLLVEQAENPLFQIEWELQRQFPDVSVAALVCNITDSITLEGIFQKYHPDVVIHAAAHKHVPLMELNPAQAVRNNILGTRIVADAADKFGANHFVLISTDKAVNPTSVMGASKRIAEMYVQDLSRTSKTHFITVRFGNVLDSEGSVVQIFKMQIASGGPVTVTHSEMKRYFMTIPEASQLVLQSAAMGQGGEIFVLDMGEPVKIVDLARELITLSGLIPGEDIKIVCTGARPGEKLFEELSIEGEDIQHTKHPKISIWKNIPMDREELRSGIEQLFAISQTQSSDEIIRKIGELVPEYKNQRTASSAQRTEHKTQSPPVR